MNLLLMLNGLYFLIVPPATVCEVVPAAKRFMDGC
jgi:hypothetical protein